jgi:hypothetical protein
MCSLKQVAYNRVVSVRNVANLTEFYSKKLKGSDHLQDLGIDGKIELKYILNGV